MRKFKRAEEAAYGNRKSSRSQAEDGSAALDILRSGRARIGWLATWRLAPSGMVLRVLSAKQSSLLVAQEYQRTARRDDLTAAEALTREQCDPKNGAKSTAPVTTPSSLARSFRPRLLASRNVPSNRLRLGNHLYRMPCSSISTSASLAAQRRVSAVRELVARSNALLGAVPRQARTGPHVACPRLRIVCAGRGRAGPGSQLCSTLAVERHRGPHHGF